MRTFTHLGGKKMVTGLGGSTHNITIKFYVFLLHEGKEMILFDAIRKGYIIEMGSGKDTLPNSKYTLATYRYRVHDNIKDAYIKVFTSIAGFGTQQRYVSKYCKLEDSSLQKITICNIPAFEEATPVCVFSAQGTILNTTQVNLLLQGNSQALKFYNGQATLPTTTMQSMMANTISKEVMRQRRIRHIKI